MSTAVSPVLLNYTQGPLRDLVLRLISEDGDSWEKELEHFVHKEPCWNHSLRIVEEPQSAPAPQYSDPIPMIFNVGSPDGFIARNNFFICNGYNSKVKISYLGSNFIKWFLSGDGKTEAPSEERVLGYRELARPVLNANLISSLGGAQASEMLLSESFSLIKYQWDGSGGHLLNDGRSNLFYVRDINQVIRSIHVHWQSAGENSGWHIIAREVDYSHVILDKTKVFYPHVPRKSDQRTIKDE